MVRRSQKSNGNGAYKAHIKSGNFVASSLIFQCAVLAYNTIRWMMALLSDNKQLKRWEVQTVRTYLIRTAGKLLTGGKQLISIDGTKNRTTASILAQEN